jgi:hypothetical protein
MDEIDVMRRMTAEPSGPDAAARQRIVMPLMERIDAAAPRRARRLSRRAATVVLAAASIAVAGGALAWALSNGSARDTVSVQCLIRGNDAIIAAASGDPLADCAANWRRSTGSNPPKLVAYDNGLGGITVMAVGETPPPGATALPDGATQNVSLVAVQQSLDDYVDGLNSGCFDSTTAVEMTQQTLTRYGLTDWTISAETGGSSSSTTSQEPDAKPVCVRTSILDPATRTVQLRGAAGDVAPSDAQYEKLAAKLRPIAQECLPLDAAAKAVRSAADSVGLSEAGNGYQLTEVSDKRAGCTTIDENVGGTIFLILRGPTG